MTYGEGFGPGTYYFSFAAIAFMVLFLAFSFINKVDYNRTSRMMRTTGILAFIGCMSEMISMVAFSNRDTSDMTRRILALINYSTMMICSMYFNRYTLTYVTKEKHQKMMAVYKKINVIWMVAFHLVLVGDLKFHYLFVVEDGIAKGGPVMMFMGYGGPLVYLLFGIGAVIYFRNNLEKREFYTLIATHVVVSMGATLQGITNDRVLLVSFSVTMGLYMLYSFLEAPDYHRLLESNRKLAEAEKAANSANRAKSDFLSSMSHEIRTPMNAVLGMNELTRMTLSDPSLSETSKVEKATTYSESIKESGEALMYVINDILDISKIESGKMDIVEAPYHIKDLLDDVSRTCDMISTKKGLSFESDIDGDLPGYVNGDKVRVRQIVVNILNNAVKYTEKGKIKFSVKGSVNGDTVVYDMAVTDTGIGIKEENIPHIFSVFDRVDDEKTHFIEGTGLGLSIVKDLITMMGGSVEVESVYGEGSTFTLHIPQKKLSDERIADRKRDDTETMLRSEKHFAVCDGYILVVDDNTTNIAVAKSFLDRMQAKTDTALSGREALELLEKNRYDLVLLDHMMPEMSGDVVLRTVRDDKEKYSLNKDTPFIAMTANAISGQKEMYINEFGFDGYLAKPFRYKELAGTVAKYLSMREVSKEEVKVEETNVMNGGGSGAQEGGSASGGAMDAIDRATGIMMCENEEIYEAVIKAYLMEVDFNVETLNEAFEAKDWVNYRTMVHKLKSASKTVGAVAFSDLSLKMEMCAKDIIAGNEAEKAIDFITSNYREYMEIYEKVCENLNKV